MSFPPPICPSCSAELELGTAGEIDVWACAAGHGLALTLTVAHGRVQDDEIAKIWHGSETGAASTVACPMCRNHMVTVEVGIDADEAAEGEPGDLPDTAHVSVDVCREDEVIWFDAGELEQFPQDLPNPDLTPEQQRGVVAITAAFDHDLAEYYEADGDRGLLNHMANAIVRRHPHLTRTLDHAVYGDELADDAQRPADAA